MHSQEFGSENETKMFERFEKNVDLDVLDEFNDTFVELEEMFRGSIKDNERLRIEMEKNLNDCLGWENDNLRTNNEFLRREIEDRNCLIKRLRKHLEINRKKRGESSLLDEFYDGNLKTFCVEDLGEFEEDFTITFTWLHNLKFLSLVIAVFAIIVLKKTLFFDYFFHDTTQRGRIQIIDFQTVVDDDSCDHGILLFDFLESSSTNFEIAHFIALNFSIPFAINNNNGELEGTLFTLDYFVVSNTNSRRVIMSKNVGWRVPPSQIIENNIVNFEKVSITILTDEFYGEDKLYVSFKPVWDDFHVSYISSSYAILEEVF